MLLKGGELFFCGNFGIMLLDNLASPQVKEILSTMLRVTMMRGAQSAGLVTYDAKGAGTRKRVVNGKRTDFGDLLMAKFGAQVNTGAISAPQLFQGHTRFATSSIANFAGCHPHQWTPPKTVKLWKCNSRAATQRAARSTSSASSRTTAISTSLRWHGTVYPLDDVFALLDDVFLCCTDPSPRRSTRRASPAFSTSCAARACGTPPSGTATSLARFETPATSRPRSASTSCGAPATLAAIAGDLRADVGRVALNGLGGDGAPIQRARQDARACCESSSGGLMPSAPAKIGARPGGCRRRAHRSAVGAFFRAGPARGGRQLLAKAEGSFGLVLSTSLDAARDVIRGARPDDVGRLLPAPRHVRRLAPSPATRRRSA